MELLVAMFLTTTGLLAVAGTLDASRELVSTSERKEAVTHQGEREVEELLALPHASLALKTVPPHNPQPDDPDFYVANGPPATYKWDNRNPASPSERFAVTATPSTCSLTPPAQTCVDTKTNWSDGRLSGKVHRYVTCVDDAATTAASTPAGCPLGMGFDYKRVTVAVTVSDGAPRMPTLFSSMVIPPS